MIELGTPPARKTNDELSVSHFGVTGVGSAFNLGSVGQKNARATAGVRRGLRFGAA
jgi:hypothetical protein